MTYSVYSWLTTCPSNDCNFKAALKRATVDEIKRAISYLSGKEHTKTAIKTCECELRRREREARS